MLDWFRDPALRRRVQAGLNKGEARNALARAVFMHRLGEIMSHLSPLGWEHINLTGDYIWKSNRIPASGKFRRLRPAKVERSKKGSAWKTENILR